MKSGELARIALLARVLGVDASKDGVVLGIGDDAAVLDLASMPDEGDESDEGAARLVWTVDAQVDGTHFRRDLCSWEDVGWRSFMAAANDVAAMGARAWCALSSLVLAPEVTDEELEALARGQRAASDAVGAPVVGGNLARGAPSSVTTTLLGTCTRVLTRGGGRAGDALFLAGDVGLAAGGLRARERGLTDARLDIAIAAWARPHARFAEGRRMAASEAAHAAIDVSDGLARDVLHLANASGLRAVLDARLLRDACGEPLAGVAAALGVDALELALHGGEDYALVLAASAPVVGFVKIGELRQGEGLALRSADGSERALDAGGFDHFAR